MKHSNNIYSIGIDSGSTVCKIALSKADLDGEKKIIDVNNKVIGWQSVETAKMLCNVILSKHGIDKTTCRFISTGYGREQIDWADKRVTEITAHGKGAFHLQSNISGVIDIGGQDSKIMKLDNKKVLDFIMNDKCAAGTGRFLELVCSKLEIPIDTIDDFINSDDYVPINSMCAVFAESEIIGLLSTGTEREQLLNGAIRSICSRISNMASRLNTKPEDIFLLTGGLSKSAVILNTLKNYVDFYIVRDDMSPYAGAIGASLL